jgi:hypothetical protein
MTKRGLAASIFVAALAAFIASSIWYGAIFGGIWRQLAPSASGSVGPPEIVAQFTRNLIVGAVLARLIVSSRAADWLGAVRVGLWCWLGFQAMAIAGSVIHEGYPLTLYAIHTGDALVTTLLMSFVIGFWRQRSVGLHTATPP